MEFGTALRKFAEVLDGFEANGCEIAEVRIPNESSPDDDEVSGSLVVNLPIAGGTVANGVELSARGATVCDDGSLQLDLDVTVPFSEDGSERSVTGSESTIDTEASETGSTDGASTGKDSSDENGDEAYKDAERLAEVYETYDSFGEMTEALDVDVTPQTVRRHMIQHGIHEPNPTGSTPDTSDDEADQSDDPVGKPSDQTNGNGNEESMPVPDGVDLPDGISMGELIEIVESARTVHEVQQKVGFDRDRTRQLLEDLDLLEFVSGRLSNAEKEISAAELEKRIRTSA